MAGSRRARPRTGRNDTAPRALPGTSMELFDTTQIGLERALSGAARRQSAIATNIANVNTPGYQRQDVSFESQLQTAFAAQDRSRVESVAPAVGIDRAAPVRADGGTVDIDTEAAAQAKNGLTYEAIATVLKARTAILQNAMGV
jgi:flagellar basal-body rod protein FlgB